MCIHKVIRCPRLNQAGHPLPHRSRQTCDWAINHFRRPQKRVGEMSARARNFCANIILHALATHTNEKKKYACYANTVEHVYTIFARKEHYFRVACRKRAALGPKLLSVPREPLTKTNTLARTHTHTYAYKGGGVGGGTERGTSRKFWCVRCECVCVRVSPRSHTQIMRFHERSDTLNAALHVFGGNVYVGPRVCVCLRICQRDVRV